MSFCDKITIVSLFKVSTLVFVFEKVRSKVKLVSHLIKLTLPNRNVNYQSDFSRVSTIVVTVPAVVISIIRKVKCLSFHGGHPVVKYKKDSNLKNNSLEHISIVWFSEICRY